MLGPIFALIVTCVMVRFLLKKYQAHLLLTVAGFVLLYFAIFMNLGDPAGTTTAILKKIKPSGLVWFEPINFFTSTLASRAAGLGMLIMAASGYAKYMDKIGASRVLANTLVKPLRLLKSPYLVVGLAYLVGQFLNIFIPSASGLAMLLMVTIYPVLLRLGVSPLAAAACVGTTGALDLGPASGNANLAATQANLDVMVYFVKYQIPAGTVVALAIAIAHSFTQKIMDAKDKWTASEEDLAAHEAAAKAENEAPGLYIILPVLPLVVLLVFSLPGLIASFVKATDPEMAQMLTSMAIAKIKVSVPMAMFGCGFIAIACEIIRFRGEVKEVFKGFMAFFDTMGTQFARVITLIVAGETFARGLEATGAVDAVIKGAQSFSIGATGIIIVMTLLIAVSAVIMGSGNAPFFAFAALAPKVSAEMGVAAVAIAMPMQLVAGIARGISPITAVIVATAGLANLNPFDLVRRTAIPMAVGVIATIVMGIILE
ncbi:MAG: Putative cryptic C4-dicarboxylate transporter DcuD [Desulfovibrio sp.]